MKHYFITTTLMIVITIPLIVNTGIRFQKAEDRLSQIELKVTHLQTESIQKDKKLSDALESVKKDNVARVKTISNLQQQIASQEKKTIALARDVEKKVAPIAKDDLSTLVSEWSPRVVRIGCVFNSGNAFGSGLVEIMDTIGLVVLTNRHVLTDNNGDKSYGCVVQFTNGELREVKTEQTHVRWDKDWGWIILPLDGITMERGTKVCKENPLIGDQVVILGYPGIGSQDGITATEGIISGIEKDYFVTSAKVEHGNSGGAAILVKDDCYLGPPSYGQSGTVESLSRILNVRLLF